MSQPTSDPEFQLASVFDVMADAIGIHEAGRLVTLNPSCLALFGYTDPNELLGRSLLVLIASEEHPRVTEFVSRRGTNEPPPTTYVTKGAAPRRVEVRPRHQRGQAARRWPALLHRAHA
jgi:PAS domain S-box-containing protein